jgi:hypothetical protein
MSTRSIVLFTGQGTYSPETVRLYKHSDGYPTDNLRLIRDALKRSKDINKAQGDDSLKVPPEGVAALLIGASVSVYGPAACIDDDDGKPAIYYGALFKPAHLSTQCDLEWIYLVNLDAKTVSVYGGGFTGKAPQAAYKRGEVDPLTYALKLKQEFQDAAGARILELVAEIETMGYVVNPSLKSKDEASTRATEVKSEPKPAKAKPRKKVKSELKSSVGLSDKDIEALVKQAVTEALAKRKAKGA